MLIRIAVLESPHTLVLVLRMAAMAAVAAGIFGTRTWRCRDVFGWRCVRALHWADAVESWRHCWCNLPTGE